ncbi:MAG: hypothetical protein HS051_03825 [Thaumarchaeota archaeon]|jgi:hypothetical protein|nr:hypothetical protein [Nitrososphaerales archaeon]NSL73783.1 hypothetical protein [Nitrososphaerota archaeon]NSL75636.1 hypothetical protein [Nitrososphaerota archaeon]NSL77508.1 hypothetical protein [Nitrososphaerota archaeon]
MNKDEIIKKATEYVNLFGYIQWNELKTINFDNDSSTWIVSFSAKQNDTSDIFSYTLEIDEVSGDISNMQMIDD